MDMMQSSNGREDRRNIEHEEQEQERALLWILARIGVCLLGLVLMVTMVDHIIVSGKMILQDVDRLVSYTQETIQTLITEPTEILQEPTPSDTVPPEITGVRPIHCYVGDAVSYRVGITIRDDQDRLPALTVDSSQVDLSTPGTYEVRYVAADASGNQTVAETTVVVREKQEGYVEPAEIEALADDLLTEIVTEDMDKAQQVRAVYQWLRSHCRYRDGSDKSDYMQAAYAMLTWRQGDCYNYFSAAKLFFDRLGIENRDVEKLRSSDRDSCHYWNMVSLDGRDWYHVDCTPRMGQMEDFCLVSDQVLDDYSESHGNCHRRDNSLYPATPETSYGR